VNRGKEYAIELGVSAKPRWFNWSAYMGMLLVIIIFAGELQEFIYFQF
jgi:hypothetical protein